MISPHRSRAHLTFVRELRCAFCIEQPAAEAHHAFRRAGGGGMGIKGCDLLTVPLCLMHHRELHKTGVIAPHDRAQTESLLWRAVAMTLRQRLLGETP
jgi:hypothetical protein